MKKIYFALVSVALMAGFFTSCKKEGTVTLFARIDQSSNAKAYVDNQYACWSNGDQVRINGGTYNVEVSTPTSSTQAATINGVIKDDNGYYAFYPGTGEYLTHTVFGNNTDVILPSTLSYVEDGGRQILKAPMAAKSDGQNILKFHCLTTLLQVNIPAGNAILSKITIQSRTSGTYLSGTANVTFSGTTPTLGAIDDDSPHSDMIEMSFGDGRSVSGGLSVFIPIPACANGTVLRIKAFSKTNMNNYIDITVNNPSGFPANTIVSVPGPQVPALVGYELKDWIWSQHSGYIDLGIPPTNNAKFEIDFKITSDAAAAEAQYLTGSRESNNGLQYFTLTGNTNTPLRFRGTFMGEYKVCREWNREKDVRYRESMEVKLAPGSENDYKGYLTFQKYDGSGWLTYTDSTRSVTGGIPASNVPNLLVFAIRPNSSQSHSGMKMYRYRIWINGTLQHDFVPCLRTADGAVGVYDMVGTNGFRQPTRFENNPDFIVGND